MPSPPVPESDRPRTPQLDRQAELIQEIGRAAYRVTPEDGWDSAQLTLRCMSSYRESVMFIERAGADRESLWPPRGLDALVSELREVMYTSGAGTWFTMTLTLNQAGDQVSMSTKFEYDEPPQWIDGAPGSILFLEDLRNYPRDHKQTPQWLTEQIQRAKGEYPQEYAKIETRFFRTLHFRPDGTQILMGLFRRERDDDVTTDAVFRKDLKWHSTGDIVIWMKGYGHTTLREITQEEAYRHLEEGYGAGSELHAPMVETAEHGESRPTSR
jgi:hypothetical protein